jgi:hypothetical protein
MCQNAACSTLFDISEEFQYQRTLAEIKTAWARISNYNQIYIQP